MTRATHALGFFALTLGVVGCGGSSVPGGGGPSGGAYKGPHACQLLTAALAKSVLGSGVQRTRSAKPSSVDTQCQYRNAVGNVTVEAGNWAWIGKTPSSQAKPVSGIGDEASVSPLGLVARKGDRGIKVLVAITGEFSGAAATRIESRQAKLQQKLAKQLVAGL